jgi:hypothetical protein
VQGNVLRAFCAAASAGAVAGRDCCRPEGEMVRLGTFHPVAGVGSILIMAGIIILFLGSLRVRRTGQKRFDVWIDMRACPIRWICVSIVFIVVGTLLIINSPAVEFYVKMPTP